MAKKTSSFLVPVLHYFNTPTLHCLTPPAPRLRFPSLSCQITYPFQTRQVERCAYPDKKEGDQDFRQVALVKCYTDTVSDACAGSNKFGDNSTDHGERCAADDYRGEFRDVLKGTDFHLELPTHSAGDVEEMFHGFYGL